MKRISQAEMSSRTREMRKRQPYPDGDSGLRVHTVQVVEYAGRYDLHVSHTPSNVVYTDLYSLADVRLEAEDYPVYIRDAVDLACENVGCIITVTVLDSEYELRRIKKCEVREQE